jgi:hypothetical protein
MIIVLLEWGGLYRPAASPIVIEGPHVFFHTRTMTTATRATLAIATIGVKSKTREVVPYID